MKSCKFSLRNYNNFLKFFTVCQYIICVSFIFSTVIALVRYLFTPKEKAFVIFLASTTFAMMIFLFLLRRKYYRQRLEKMKNLQELRELMRETRELKRKRRELLKIKEELEARLQEQNG